MLRLQCLDADLPQGRRISDEALANLLAAASKLKTVGRRPEGAPKGVLRPLKQAPRVAGAQVPISANRRPPVEAPDKPDDHSDIST